MTTNTSISQCPHLNHHHSNEIPSTTSTSILARSRHVNTDMDETLNSLLRLFDVSPENGFLPAIDPLRSLLPSQPRFALWEELISKLSHYLHSGTWRWVVDHQLPLISVDENDLEKEEELKRALLILGMFASAYIFSEKNYDPNTSEVAPSPTTGFGITTATQSAVVDSLPPCISVPFLSVSSRLGMVPILSESSISNYNYYRISPSGPLKLGNLSCINLFYGGIDEANFYLLTVEIEAIGGRSVGEMVKASHYIRTEQREKLIRVLLKIKGILAEMNVSMSKMNDSVDPYVFYTRVRPYLSGWKGNPALPNGIQYRTTQTNLAQPTASLTSTHPSTAASNSNSALLSSSSASGELYRQYSGGSAAQSALIAAFDMFFGVCHSSENTAQYMNEMRQYMPAKHRDFLNFIQQSTSIKQYIHRLKALVDQVDMKNKNRNDEVNEVDEVEVEERRVIMELVVQYNGCVDELVKFRNKHLAIVQTYILAQAYAKNKKLSAITASVISASGSSAAAPVTASAASSSSGNEVEYELSSGSMKSRGCTYQVDATQITIKKHENITTTTTTTTSTTATIEPQPQAHHYPHSHLHSDPEVDAELDAHHQSRAAKVCPVREPVMKSMNNEEVGGGGAGVATSIFASTSTLSTMERGTGGTSILPFLRTSRDETKQVKVPT